MGTGNVIVCGCVVYPLCIARNLSHELPPTIQSIEKAIDFDITEMLGMETKSGDIKYSNPFHLMLEYIIYICIYVNIHINTLQIPPNET
jgi:hypothetical protein